MTQAAPVSVVLSVLNEGQRLADTVTSLLTAERQPAEIVVVDDGSTDGCVDGLTLLERSDAQIRVFRCAHQGIAPARAFGASKASQPMLVFLDAHCEVDRLWLEPLVEALDRHPWSMAIPTVADSRRPGDRGCGARLINDVLAYQWITHEPPPAEVGIAPGGCFAIRAATLHDLGGFAAMRHFGMEDVELSLRAWRFACPIRTVPESLMRHDFRTEAPYPSRGEGWLGNVLLTALLHLDRDRLERTLLAAAGFASFAPAVTRVLCSDWMQRQAWIDAHAVRPLDTFWSTLNGPSLLQECARRSQYHCPRRRPGTLSGAPRAQLVRFAPRPRATGGEETRARRCC